MSAAPAYDIPFACAQLFVPLCPENVPDSDFAEWISAHKHKNASMLDLVDSLDVDVDDFVNVGTMLIDVSEACQDLVKRMSEKLGIQSVRVAVTSADLRDVQESVVFKCFLDEKLPEGYEPKGMVCLNKDGRVEYAESKRDDAEIVMEMYVKGEIQSSEKKKQEEKKVKCWEWDEAEMKLVHQEYELREEVQLRTEMPFDYDPEENPYPKYPTANPGQSVLLVKTEPSDSSSPSSSVTVLVWLERENGEFQPISVPFQLLRTPREQYQSTNGFTTEVLKYIKREDLRDKREIRKWSRGSKPDQFDSVRHIEWVVKEKDSSVVLKIKGS